MTDDDTAWKKYMADTTLTDERVEELLAFLPMLEDPQTPVVLEWKGMGFDDTKEFPYSIYSIEIKEFFRIAAQPWWSDPDYLSYSPSDMIKDDAAIASANLDQLKAMLSWCVRDERFCSGHWEAVVRLGKVAAVLRRLREMWYNDR